MADIIIAVVAAAGVVIGIYFSFFKKSKACCGKKCSSCKGCAYKCSCNTADK